MQMRQKLSYEGYISFYCAGDSYGQRYYTVYLSVPYHISGTKSISEDSMFLTVYY